MFAKWARDFQKHINQLPLFDQVKARICVDAPSPLSSPQQLSNSVGGDPSIRYYHSYWQLAADEALVGRGANQSGCALSPLPSFPNFR